MERRGRCRHPDVEAIADACFLSASSGFALDATGAVLRTGNGGSSWQTLSAQAGSSVILALDSSNVFLAGSHGIERSTTGGQSFAAVVTGAEVDPLQPAGAALVASGPRHAYASTDGGASWRAIVLPPHQRRRSELASAAGRRPADHAARRGRPRGLRARRDRRRVLHSRATAFVAQWAGDVSHSGAGSPAVIVKP